jgi:hypothetical protein
VQGVSFARYDVDNALPEPFLRLTFGVAILLQVLSRMVDAVTARVSSRTQIAGLAAHSTIPIINALDNNAHPLQMLADIQVRVF